MNPQVVVDFVANTKGLQKGVAESSGASSGFASKLKSIGKAGALAAGAAGVGALVATIKIGIDEYSEAAKVAAQTNAVLKSTGEVAGVTADHVSNLAGKLMEKSGIDDEAIQSGENLLLTFTNIRNEVGKGNDIFDQTTAIMTDMSAALGQDTKTSAIQLGKALNDPIKGVSALQRVGVSFTAGQKAQIKALVGSGKTMEAQKLILKELNKEFGGSAEALGKTLPGEINIAKQTFSNWAGELVSKTIPVIQATIGWLRDHWPEISAALKQAWGIIGPLLTAIGKLVIAIVKVFTDNWSTIGPIVQKVANLVRDEVRIIVDVIKLLTALLTGDWAGAWEQMQQIVRDVLAALVDELKLTGALVGGILKAVDAIASAIVDGLAKGLSAIGSAAWDQIKQVGSTISGKLGEIKGWGSSIASSIKSAITGALSGIGQDAWAVLDNIGAAAANALGTVKGWGTSVGAAIKSGVVGGLVGIATDAWDVINNIGSTLLGFVGTVKGWGTNVGNWIKNAVVAALVGIGQDAWNVINNIGSFLDGVKNTVVGWGSKVGGWIVDGITGAFGGLKDLLTAAIKGPINAVLKAWNGLQIPKIKINLPGPLPDVSAGPWSLPDLPTLARGGVVSSPTLALIGEGRESEIVAPESLLRRLMREAGAGQAGDVRVRVFLGDQELRGMVRTEVEHSNAGIARTLIAGSV